MSWAHAGQWSGDILYRTKGAVANAPITITDAGSNPATLYTDAGKGTTLPSNTVNTDGNGNLSFFADPGTYTCTSASGATFPAVVAVSPLDNTEGALLAASNLSDVASAPTSRTSLGLGTAATQASSAFDTAGAATAAQAAAQAASDPAGSASAVQALAALRASNLSDLASAPTARTNLGLGSAALLASSAVAQTANNLSDLASASTARTNLGLGSAATHAATDFDASGAASTALASAEAFASGLQPTSGAPLGLSVGGTGQSAGSAAALLAALGGMTLLAATVAAGFALQNATPSIISWTAPSDSAVHRVFAIGEVHVATTETGGQVSLTSTSPGNNAMTFTLDGGGHAASDNPFTVRAVLVKAGSTVTVAQTSALTGGSATVYAELWGL
jgi:hypothetical protein